MVRAKGLEPPRLSPPEPKSGVSTISPRPRAGASGSDVTRTRRFTSGAAARQAIRPDRGAWRPEGVFFRGLLISSVHGIRRKRRRQDTFFSGLLIFAVHGKRRKRRRQDTFFSGLLIFAVHGKRRKRRRQDTFFSGLLIFAVHGIRREHRRQDTFFSGLLIFAVHGKRRERRRQDTFFSGLLIFAVHGKRRERRRQDTTRLRGCAVRCWCGDRRPSSAPVRRGRRLGAAHRSRRRWADRR